MAETAETLEQLPILPEHITASWLAEKLQRTITHVEATGVEHGTASKLFYTLSLDDGDELKTCVKGGFNPAMRAAVPLAVKWWINEAKFFQSIAASLPFMEPPHCLWSGSDSRQGIVIMPNLADKGFTFGDPKSERSVAEVIDGVEQLAGLHAATWGKTVDDFPWLAGQPNYMDFVLPELSEGKFDQYGGDVTRPIPNKMLHAHPNPRFNALLHGDAHLANTFYKPVLRFLDWQLYFIGPVFHDVSYFIASSLSIEHRRANEKMILDHYLETLVRLAEGKVPCIKKTDEDVWTEHRKSFLSGFGWFVTPYVMQPPERVHPMIRRYATAIEDHHVVELVESSPDVPAS
ncbi:hypothetical protein PRZ48_013274 [Zasmidium cellare]|uniref:CHK kinase-like domain-containing protein n=1 Tax=Zasmidium cellare TaxID=395010 RepID=A0ABR0E3N2_ZASCE|nr:hypothetical protein PRZ48_013274 [Zasmidium cellare]